jgi:ribonuclease G
MSYTVMNNDPKNTIPESDNDAHFIDELHDSPKDDVVINVHKDKLQAEAKVRAKQRPLLQKIMKVLRREDQTYRELIINTEPLERRVALLVDGVLDKLEMERTGENRMVGAIFKGKIQNLEPGLKAAFVDIGEEKNAFLHYWDILPSASDATIEVVRENRSKAQKQNADKVSIKDIPRLYPIGTDIIVQISKSQIGSKGPRTTTNIALPGRYIVLMPYSGECGISRKIEDRKERDRLKKILKGLTIPEGMGVIIRTAGEGKKIRYFIRDLHLLLKKWEEIMSKMERSKDPVRLYQEPDIIERTIRDFLTEEIDRVLVDNEEDFHRMVELVEVISPRSRTKIHLYKDNIPIFERFNIERQIEQTFHRRVPLQSGGEIVIEETEALTAIDVNTGGHKGSTKDGKDFILNCNLEAALEASRQIRLRNIGGLIIIDFIDMKNKRDRNLVLAKMRQQMETDKAKTHILPISQLGIMQMTRQRHTESTARSIYTMCPYCHGRSIVKGPRAMSVEIQRRLVSAIRRIRAHKHAEMHLRVFLHPTNLERLRTEDEQYLIEIEKAYNVKLSFRAEPAIHVENFKIVNAITGEELR